MYNLHKTKHMNNIDKYTLNRINLFLTDTEAKKLRNTNSFCRNNIINPNILRRIDFVENLVNQKQKIFKNLDLSNLKFKDISFAKGTQFWLCKFNKTVFKNCNLENCKFLLYTNLQFCEFINCNLTNCKMNYCNLRHVQFKGSNLFNISLYKSDYNSYTIFNDGKNYTETSFNTINMRRQYI